MRSSRPAIAGVSRWVPKRCSGGSWNAEHTVGAPAPRPRPAAPDAGAAIALSTLPSPLPHDDAMARILYLTQIDIDFGAVRLLPEECQRTGMRKPLVVTDRGVRAAGVLDSVLQALGGLAHAVYDGTPSNPTEAAVREALVAWREAGCDGLVAVGGGSSMDLAKGWPSPPPTTARWPAYATIEGGSPRISERVLPLIAVPTTAGTGSEVARGAIVIVDDGRKLGFHSWHLMPKAALLDPELTLGLPPR
jgi:4-hydroxybutyrate dehydrogenase